MLLTGKDFFLHDSIRLSVVTFWPSKQIEVLWRCVCVYLVSFMACSSEVESGQRRYAANNANTLTIRMQVDTTTLRLWRMICKVCSRCLLRQYIRFSIPENFGFKSTHLLHLTKLSILHQCLKRTLWIWYSFLSVVAVDNVTSQTC